MLKVIIGETGFTLFYSYGGSGHTDAICEQSFML